MKSVKMYQEILSEPEKLSTCFKENVGLVHGCVEKIRERQPALVVISGRGTSKNAGRFAKYLYETQLGIPVMIAEPSVVSQYNGKLNLKNALVIGISQSGAAQDVCTVIDRAKENGATTIAITNTEDSLLARHSAFHLNCCAGKEESLAATKTFVTQMLLLSMLGAEWSGNAAEMERLQGISDLVERVYLQEKSIGEIAKSWNYITECYLIARGLLLPIAEECEIKMQETSQIHAHAYSAAEFLHGPISLVSPRAPVLAFACDKHTDESVFKTIARVQKDGARVCLITNKQEIAKELKDDPILLPQEAEGVSGAFAAATAIQLLACMLSVFRGKNPDSPHGLTKITVTN